MCRRLHGVGRPQRFGYSLPGRGSGKWSRHSDSNRGPAVYETAALPLSYVGATGIVSRAIARVCRRPRRTAAKDGLARRLEARHRVPSGYDAAESPASRLAVSLASRPPIRQSSPNAKRSSRLAEKILGAAAWRLG
jgi:hypothetical protein